MSLVTPNEILIKAMKEGYGVAAFNANCLEMIPALVKAAEEEKSALILQIGKKFLDYLPPHFMAGAAIELAKKSSIPVAIHLDHGNSFEMNKECLEAGFTSLMYDGSQLSMEENIKNTKRVVEFANRFGIPVEGEVGKVGSAEDVTDYTKVEGMTEPSEAQQFVEATGVFSLAVSIGNVHRMKIKEAHLDFDRIKSIKKSVDVPLVMHGSSGISDADIQKAIKAGITKVNIATEFNITFINGVKAKLGKNPGEVFPMEIMTQGMADVIKMAKDRMRMLGCSQKY